MPASAVFERIVEVQCILQQPQQVWAIMMEARLSSSPHPWRQSSVNRVQSTPVDIARRPASLESPSFAVSRRPRLFHDLGHGRGNGLRLVELHVVR